MNNHKIEIEIAKLEEENKHRKQDFPIAAVKLGYFSQTSPIYSKTGSNNELLTFRVKFTPDTKPPSGYSLTQLRPKISVYSNMSQVLPFTNYCNEIQSGNGSVVVKFFIGAPKDPATYYFTITAYGPSEGTFSLM